MIFYIFNMTNHYTVKTLPARPAKAIPGRLPIFSYQVSQLSTSQYTTTAGRFHLPAANTFHLFTFLSFFLSFSFSHPLLPCHIIKNQTLFILFQPLQLLSSFLHSVVYIFAFFVKVIGNLLLLFW